MDPLPEPPPLPDPAAFAAEVARARPALTRAEVHVVRRPPPDGLTVEVRHWVASWGDSAANSLLRPIAGLPTGRGPQHESAGVQRLANRVVHALGAVGIRARREDE